MRLATALARAAIAQGLAEDAAVRSGAGSLAAGRGQRRETQETNAAIDRDAASDSPATNARTTLMAVRHLDFEQSAPFPADWTEEQKYGPISFDDHSGGDNWYEWCPVHWWTKWNAP